MLKNQQKIKLSWASVSHQNGTEEHSTKTVVPITRTMMINSSLRYPNNTLSIDFDQ